MQRPPHFGSLQKTWCASWLMPDVVLPEPVSPVMSQPRQKSLRFQVNPFNRATRVDFGQNSNNAMTSQTPRATTAMATHESSGHGNVKGTKSVQRESNKLRCCFIAKTSRSGCLLRAPLQSPEIGRAHV